MKPAGFGRNKFWGFPIDKIKNFHLIQAVGHSVNENISDYKAKIYWALYRDTVQIAKHFVELL